MALRLLVLLSALVAVAASADGHSTPGERDGQVRVLNDGGFRAWDAVGAEWLSPEEFWASFAARGRGRAWPSGSEYPPYASVEEHDTFLVTTDAGPCLMYFFHTRWRRANDVWRWGNEFNRYGGCPTVFD